MVQSLRYWQHCLFPKEFIIFSNYEALKYLNSQQKLNARHARWVEYLQSYTFVLKHKAGSENCAADALSRRVTLLFTSQVEVTGFERIKEEYNDCPDLGTSTPTSPPIEILESISFRRGISLKDPSFTLTAHLFKTFFYESCMLEV